MIGTKVLINSQTGGAGFASSYGYNGTNCNPVHRWTGPSEPFDFTPINSIVLVKWSRTAQPAPTYTRPEPVR